MNTQRILVTGASGFIGRRLVPMLLKTYSKEQIFCVVHEKDSPHELLGRSVLDAHGISYRKIELLNPDSLIGLPTDSTTVIHLAASTDTDGNDFSANDVGTRNLLAAIGPLTANTHFIFASSAAVYAGRTDLHMPIRYDTPPRPNNEYGRSKLRAEEFLLDRAQQEGFQLTVTRFNTVYGPAPRSNSLLDVLKNHVLGGSVLVRLNWPGLIGIVHVEDVGKKLAELATSSGMSRPQMLIFSTESLTLAEMYESICTTLNRPYRRLNLPSLLWTPLSFALRYSLVFEKILPTNIFNILWRGNLVVRGVFNGETDDVRVAGSEPRMFAESIKEILI